MTSQFTTYLIHQRAASGKVGVCIDGIREVIHMKRGDIEPMQTECEFIIGTYQKEGNLLIAVDFSTYQEQL